MTLIIENITKRYITKRSQTEALSNINLSVHDGEFLCILGPSGCGKSTLLNMIAGLEKPQSGQIIANGEIVIQASSKRAMVFQEAALFPWLQVQENVEYGLKINGVKKEERHRIAQYYLNMVHLWDCRNAYIHELSGGMRQRVAIARALCMDADFLLMDEPFGALDSNTRRNLYDELLAIWKETKKTIVFVTHNIEEALYLADRIIVMQSNPGKIIQEIVMNREADRQFEKLNQSEDYKKITALLKGLEEDNG